MELKTYSTFNGDKNRRRRRRIIGVIVILLILLSGLYVLGIFTSDGQEYTERSEIIRENHALRERVAELEERVSELETMQTAEPIASPSPTPIIPRG